MPRITSESPGDKETGNATLFGIRGFGKVVGKIEATCSSYNFLNALSLELFFSFGNKCVFFGNLYCLD